jgi:hypothetical protein
MTPIDADKVKKSLEAEQDFLTTNHTNLTNQSLVDRSPDMPFQARMIAYASSSTRFSGAALFSVSSFV